MRTKLLWLSLPVTLLVLLPIGLYRKTARSVRPFVDTTTSVLAPSQFDPAQSAGFFCGIRQYQRRSGMTPVQFAADDAIDLAYAFTIENDDLLKPSRVTIALSGHPVKAESEERLRRLKAAGAKVVMDVDVDDVRRHLREQAASAGRGGLFVASFATHGFSSDGIPYLLARDSKFLDVETSIPVPEVAEIAGSSAARSLILLDACRERVSSVIRAGLAEPRSAAPILERMKKIEGQVIFSAAAPGGYAFDDPDRRNGVFTAAVIDSLQCEGTSRMMVTVDHLAKAVERKVLHFLKKRDPSLKKATQISTEGRTDLMPLARCRPPLPPIEQVAAVHIRGTSIVALNADGRALWEKKLDGTIRGRYVGQLFREKTNYVVVLSDLPRGDRALVSIYDNAGNPFSSYEHDGPPHHMEVQKPTASHNPRIVLAGLRRNVTAQLGLFGSVPTVMRLWAKNPGKLTEEWCVPVGRPGETVTQLRVAGDGKQRAIVITTSARNTLRLNFDGRTFP